MGVPYEQWAATSPEKAHLHPDHPSRPLDAKPAAKGAKRSKYRNVRTAYNGRKYASKAEATRAERLDHDLKAGLIKFWLPQPRFMLGCPENVYVGDMLVVDAAGNVWVDDVKGIETAKFKHNKRLWKAYGPCPLRILRRGKVVEVIEPIGGIDG